MKEVMRDDAFGREDAPPELRLPPVQRALRVVRPVSDAMARRSKDAAEVISRQTQSLGRYSAAQVKARPFATAAVALAAGTVLGILLSPRRRTH
jgi:ElaB/YqjD/DUF883 family membrane-anchored ribosome-binding protein